MLGWAWRDIWLVQCRFLGPSPIGSNSGATGVGVGVVQESSFKSLHHAQQWMSSFHTWRYSGLGYECLSSELEEMAEWPYVKGESDPNDYEVHVSSWTQAWNRCCPLGRHLLDLVIYNRISQARSPDLSQRGWESSVKLFQAVFNSPKCPFSNEGAGTLLKQMSSAGASLSSYGGLLPSRVFALNAMCRVSSEESEAALASTWDLFLESSSFIRNELTLIRR